MSDGATGIIVFNLDGQRYGLRLSDVQELLPAASLVRLPAAAPIVEGLLNLRGTILPVLDLRRRFGLPAKGMEPSDHLLAVSAGERLVGLRVDRAMAIVWVDESDIVDARAAVPAVQLAAGVAKLGDGLVVIHDLSGFLSQAEADSLAEMVALAETAEASP